MREATFTAEEAATIDYYNEHGAEWATSHDVVRYWGAAFGEFQHLLPTGKILEIGAGAGRDAQTLGEMGCDYTGTDISTGMFALAQERNPGIKLSQQSVYELAFADKTFDGFWAAAVLLHLPKARLGEALGEIQRVCKNNAIGFIAVKDGMGEEVIGDGRLFSYYQYGEMNPILHQSGFAVLDSVYWPKGKKTTWRMFFVQAIKL